MDSIQESRMSSKIPLRTLLRISSSNGPRGLKFCTELPQCLCMSFLTSIVNSHLYSIQESRISSETPWRTLWKLKGECPVRVHLEVCNFAQSFLNIYKCHSGHPKSSTLHSGIKNVLQDSLKEALDPRRRMSSSRGLTFCTELL